MTEVAELYNDLLTINTKRNGEGLYPIHKKVDYENPEIDNLYRYLLDKYEIPESGKLLDCGCGVGYGTQLLAIAKPGLQVHGISLSDGEVAVANKMATKAGLQNRCHFEVQSFDEVPTNTYDCIIAIESLKHSANIKNTMNRLLKSLKPGGLFIVVEDVGGSKINNWPAKRQCADWELERIFTLEDFHGTDKLINKKVEILTPKIATPNYVSILLRLLGSELLALGENIGVVKNKGAKILRGGFYQEYLYSTGKLDYMILSGALTK